MKPGMAVFLALLIAGGFVSAEGIAEDAAQTEEQLDLSYAFGMVIGSDLKQTGLTFDYNAFSRGLRDSMGGGETRFSMDEAIRIMQTSYMAVMTERAETNRQAEIAFLEENRKKAGVIVTESGLQYEVITEGGGQRPQRDDTVRVHYEGSLMDGTVFDSSYSRGEPEEFPLNQVIPGWGEGLQLMGVGGTYRFYISSALAYGEEGAGSVIPPYATLIFEVELLAILDQDQEYPADAD
ncbi:MAG: FKBP-type peptidyl-prolyl cis-trans isomerase [Treponema sp.]|jgi:FKBP-type peptidyl-prolyl cis-trans isomerase|nr:FKBP-type peptidyl-prolyl cis-trans isomerase [Treponema sp.]